VKNIESKLIPLLRQGFCAPQIARIAKKTREPATTIHYNIHRMEREGKILACKAVIDSKKIGQGFTAFVLINLSPDEYGEPERIAKELMGYDEIESIDIITGDWEMLLKIRTSGQDAYYDFVKNVISRKGISKINSLMSLKQVKTEFIVTQSL
jgi:Lrp/AsnC family transcriptional regulator, leucine-responsive regulatory protein